MEDSCLLKLKIFPFNVSGQISDNIKLYEVCPQSIQPCNMKIEIFIEQDTRNTVHRTMMP